MTYNVFGGMFNPTLLPLLRHILELLATFVRVFKQLKYAVHQLGEKRVFE